MSTPLKLGVQYYREPNPPEKCWRRDLADIAQAGMSFIGCWVPWRYVNPEQDRWELDPIRRLLDLAAENGLGVRLQLVPESAPDWAAREQPDALMVNAWGQRIPLHPHPMLQLGGWPGLNWHHPAARQWMDDYIRRTVGLLQSHPAIHFWSVWNEIQIAVFSHDPHTTNAFRAWMRKRFGDIGHYNEAHHTRFLDFDEVPLPNPQVQDAMVLSIAADLAEFKWERSVAEGQHRVKLVRELDQSRPVIMHTNTNTPYLNERDDWSVAASADLYGNSCYNTDPFYDTMSDIKQRSIKGQGKWLLTERCGGRMVYYYGHQTAKGHELVSDALKAFAHGAIAASFWQYRCERGEQEAPNFGLLNQDGSRSERLDAVADLAGKLKRWNPEGMVLDPAEIGMLFEPLDLVFRNCGDAWMKQPAQEWNETEQWLRALLDMGLSPDFLDARQLRDASAWRRFKVIVVPSLVALRQGTAAALSAWAHQGGCLIAGPFAGVFNARGEAFETTPGDGLSELFGLRIVDRIGGQVFPFVDPDTRAEHPGGASLFEQARLAGAHVLLECRGMPAVTENRVGRGRAIYATSFISGALRAPSFLNAWLGRQLQAAGIRSPVEFEGPVWLNAARCQEQRILFVGNPSPDAACAATLIVPDIMTVTDPLGSQSLQRNGNAIMLSLAPRQTLALTMDDRHTNKMRS
ncbi:MAG: beta-galactosidase [Kiritimatiellae bacterium]|nr:beta-galactosidase [Kiritimatiellia bacterium]